MPNLVTLERFNQLVCPLDPVPMPKLQRWCRDGHLPAVKFGKEWRVDLDKVDKPAGQSVTGLAIEKLMRSA